ncbi:MAG: ferritin-like domain-containing protein, partial [Ilumatobacteraceae bacterium]
MSITAKENQAIIGRDLINDVEAILSIPMTDPNEVEHVVKNNADSIFTWDYSLARPPLRKLYEKAKTGQWNSSIDIPWEMEVDIEKTIAADQAVIGNGIDPAWYA